jgi:hypothetical protein
MDGWSIEGITFCETAVIAVTARDRRDRKFCSMEEAEDQTEPS